MLVTAGWRENLELLAPLRCAKCGKLVARVILPVGSTDSVMAEQVVVSARLEIVCHRCEHRNSWPLTTVELCT